MQKFRKILKTLKKFPIQFNNKNMKIILKIASKETKKSCELKKLHENVF